MTTFIKVKEKGTSDDVMINVDSIICVRPDDKEHTSIWMNGSYCCVIAKFSFIEGILKSV
jgi:hypothetical protein